VNSPGAAVQRGWWTAERFGLTPGKLPARASKNGAPRILAVSIPKAGTHLLERALCLHPRLYRRLLPTISGENLDRHGGLDRLLGRLRPGQIMVSHLRYQPALAEIADRQGVRGLFLVRDPHDMVVSEAFFVSRERGHRHHAAFSSRGEVKEKLRLAIQGDPRHGVISIGQRLRYFEGWLDTGFLTVRFEDLVGAAGGGTGEAQSETLEAIFRHLGMDARPEIVRDIAAKLFSDRSPTFRKGAIGQWRSLFDPELQELFDAEASDELARYGYQPQAPGR
jgi:hypothetical protein